MLNVIMCTFLLKTRTEPGGTIRTNRQTEKASKQDEQTDNHFEAKEPERDGGGREGC